MLGTLAKWLRILGYDTLFDPSWNDHQLVRLARADDRILLTRDRELAGRRGVRTLLITSERLHDQIQQVWADLGLKGVRSFSRCPVCNEMLEAIDPEAVRSRVPAYIFKTHQTFRYCPICQRVYWRGTHWQRMDDRLSRLGLDASSVLEEAPDQTEQNGG